MTIGEAFQDASDNGGYIVFFDTADLESGATGTLISELLEGDDSYDSLEEDEGVSDWDWKITPFKYTGNNGEVVSCQRLSASSSDRFDTEPIDRLVFDIKSAKKIGILPEDH